MCNSQRRRDDEKNEMQSSHCSDCVNGGRITSPDAAILATLVDVYKTDDPTHLAYHQRNRDAGRMSGELRIRAICGDAVGPWTGLLLLSKDELISLLEGTVWAATEFLGDGPGYSAVITKRGM